MPCAARRQGATGVRYALASATSALLGRILQTTPPVAYEAGAPCPAEEEALEEQAVDRLLELAARIEPDGGMPGGDEEERVQATILALLAFLAEGHTERSGPFRSHVRRLLEFLEGAGHVHPMVGRILALARQGRSLRGDWSGARPGPGLWEELTAADPGESA